METISILLVALVIFTISALSFYFGYKIGKDRNFIAKVEDKIKRGKQGKGRVIVRTLEEEADKEKELMEKKNEDLFEMSKM